jgi:hypothetical protein
MQLPYSTYTEVTWLLSLKDPFWLNDNIVSFAYFLLKRQYGVEGLKDTGCQQSNWRSSLKYVPGDSIQIVNASNIHWLVATRFGGKVMLLDSLNSQEPISLSTMDIIKNVFRPGLSSQKRVCFVRRSSSSKMATIVDCLPLLLLNVL